jgi:hypothetical protein
MRQKFENVPELRVPTAWEHTLVDKYLIEEIRQSNRKGFNFSSVIGCILGAMLVCNTFGVKSTGYENIVLLGIMLLCFFITYSSKKRELSLRRLIQELEQKQYMVASAWALEIHRNIGDEPDSNFGIAKVRLENGRMLQREYRLPYSFATEMIQRGTTDNQRILLVYIPSRQLYRAVPVE